MLRLSSFLICLLFSFHAQAQGYPAKPVRMIVPFPAGGATDIIARIVSQKLGENLGQTVIVDNRPGASGNIGSDIAAKAPPDGYTLVMGNLSSHAINASLFKLPYDPVADFAPVTIVAVVTNILVTHPSLPARSVKELVALAKARPGQINYASAGSGSPAHLAGELFKTSARVDLYHVPYKGNAPAVNDLIAGEATVMFSAMPSVMPHVATGRLRALAVTTLKRSPAAPNLPTIAESGLSGFDVSAWNGVLAPARTPHDIIARMHREIVKILQLPDVKERLSGLGAEPLGDTPEHFADVIKADVAKWARVVKESGARAD